MYFLRNSQTFALVWTWFVIYRARSFIFPFGPNSFYRCLGIRVIPVPVQFRFLERLLGFSGHESPNT